MSSNVLKMGLKIAYEIVWRIQASEERSLSVFTVVLGKHLCGSI
jgi:hypothetical protein